MPKQMSVPAPERCWDAENMPDEVPAADESDDDRLLPPAELLPASPLSQVVAMASPRVICTFLPSPISERHMWPVWHGFATAPPRNNASDEVVYELMIDL
jgi:hypothetical protein